MKWNRELSREMSNNSKNPNKNVCGLFVCHALGTDHYVKYLHNVDDIIRSARKIWTVRSRTSKVKNLTVTQVREKLSKISEKEKIYPTAYILFTRFRVGHKFVGHVSLVDPKGKILVDTSPRKRDRRKVVKCYIVYNEFDRKYTVKEF